MGVKDVGGGELNKCGGVTNEGYTSGELDK